MSEGDRAIAIGIVAFFAIIVASALLYILLDPAMIDVFDMTRDQADQAVATEQIDQADQVWGLLLFYPALLGLIMIIARAVFESRGPV